MAEPLLREPPTRRLLDLAAYVWIRSKRFVRQLAHQKATTHQIALGCALGWLAAAKLGAGSAQAQEGPDGAN